MKKVLFGLLALIVLIVGSGYAWYKVSYGGTSYYMQVTQDGKTSESKDSSGRIYVDYNYKEEVYAKSGKVKTVEFSADHNLRHDAYLKLTVNNTKGVTSWEEVKKGEVPTKALEKITDRSVSK